MVIAPHPARHSLIMVFGLALFIFACSPRPASERSEAGMSVLALMSTEGRDLDVGDEIEAALSTSDYVGPDGSYMEAWSLDGRPGDTFSIDLISEEFDAYRDHQVQQWKGKDPPRPKTRGTLARPPSALLPLGFDLEAYRGARMFK